MLEKKPTIRSIAEALKLSKSTVSLALKNDPRIADETRSRIHSEAKRLGYRANPVMANLLSQLSQGQQKAYQANLAVLNIDPNEHAFEEMDTVGEWLRGCEQRADELGYRLDRFWIHHPDMNARRLAKILKTRNISGVLIINSCASPDLPEAYQEIWDEFSCFVVGNRVTKPALNFACNDQYVTTMEAIKKCLVLGFKKPGMVMCENLDGIVERKFSAGYIMGHAMSYEQEPVPMIAPRFEEKEIFSIWYKTHKPDVIVCINPWPLSWLQEMGVKVPQDVSLVSIDRGPSLPDWAGMDQNSSAIGAVAVEQLISQIHRNERGVPEIAKCVLVESSWMNGATLSV